MLKQKEALAQLTVLPVDSHDSAGLRTKLIHMRCPAHEMHCKHASAVSVTPVLLLIVMLRTDY